MYSHWLLVDISPSFLDFLFIVLNRLFLIFILIIIIIIILFYFEDHLGERLIFQ